MNLYSQLLQDAVQALSGLPGIGQRTALRFALYLLKQPAHCTQQLSNALQKMVFNLRLCENCHNISDVSVCNICTDTTRDHSTICVVEDIRDVMAIEATAQYRGVYHVLGGKIAPIEGVGPSDLTLNDLELKVENGGISEVILALSATVEGDTTNYYIYKKIAPYNVKVSVIAKGVSVGYELQYTDEVTLGRSILQRIDFETQIKKN